MIWKKAELQGLTTIDSSIMLVQQFLAQEFFRSKSKGKLGCHNFLDVKTLFIKTSFSFRPPQNLILRFQKE